VAIEVNVFAIAAKPRSRGAESSVGSTAGTDRWAEFLARATTLGMAMRDPAQLADDSVEVEIWSTKRFDGATAN